jgi:hypothetical protein
MKRCFTICLVLVLTIISINIHASVYNKRFISIKDTTITDRIAFIKQKFVEINTQLKTYKKTDVAVLGESTEGGSVSKYYDGTFIKKITQTFYGEMGKSTEEFYYDDNHLIFYYKLYTQYDKPMYINDFKVASKNEMRCYFEINKIIKYLNKPIITMPDKDLRNLGVEILKESNKALKRK